MSDYQAVYDAVRRAFSGFDPQNIVNAVRDCFDFSHHKEIIIQEVCISFGEMRRPSVLYRPTLRNNLRQWIAEYPSDLTGFPAISGVGDSPEEAMSDFDKNWSRK